MNIDDLKSIKFEHPCLTPNGVGLIVGVSYDGGEITKALVSHKPSDLSKEALEAVKWLGGPSVNLFYKIEDIQEVVNERDNKRSQPVAVSTENES